MRQFKHLNVPDHWRNYFTRYPQGYTILESLLNWVTQVDDMVDNQNALNKKVVDFRVELDDFIERFDPRLQEEVTKTLKDWQDTGFLDVVIDEALHTQMDELEDRVDNSLNSFSEQLAEIAINVKEVYGAEGDGVTDDTDSISQALLGGGNLFFPEGTYLVDGSLPLVSNTRIMFHENAILKIIPNTTGNLKTLFFTNNLENVTFEGLNIEGTSDFRFMKTINSKNLTFKGIRAEEATGSLNFILIEDSTNIVIEDFYSRSVISGTSGSGVIRLVRCSNITGNNIAIHDEEGKGFVLDDSKEAIIRKIYVESVHFDGVYLTDGTTNAHIYGYTGIDNTGSNAFKFSRGVNNCSLNDSYIKNGSIQVQGSVNCVINNVVGDECYVSINSHPESLSPSKNTTVINSTFNSSNEIHPIIRIRAWSWSDTEPQHTEEVKIINNVFNGGSYGVYFQIGTPGCHIDGVVIENNIISSPTSECFINIDGNADSIPKNIRIANNVFKDLTENVTQIISVRFAVNVTIEKNDMYCEGKAWGVRYHTAGDKAFFLSNNIVDYSGRGISPNDTENVVAMGNIISSISSGTDNHIVVPADNKVVANNLLL